MERDIYVYFQINLTLIDKICLQKPIRLLTYCHLMTRSTLHPRIIQVTVAMDKKKLLPVLKQETM